MKFRQQGRYAARRGSEKASFSTSTAYRFEKDLTTVAEEGEAWTAAADPLAGIFEAEVVSMLKAAPGLRSIAIFEEMLERHPELGVGIRRTWAANPRLARHPWGGAGHLPADPRARPYGIVRISPTWATSASRSRGRRSSTGSIISGSPIPASSTPTSCSAVKLRRLGGGDAERPMVARRRASRNIEPASLSAAFRNLDLEAQGSDRPI